jgi:voltage-gated potassium channel
MMSDDLQTPRPRASWRDHWYRVIFESDTKAGRNFDKLLVVLILVSVAVALMDSVAPLNKKYGHVFDRAEWCFTILFTLEYFARLVSAKRPLAYARSFFGIVDLLAILPTWLAIFFPEMHALVDIRVLRLLRVFRIFRLVEFVREYHELWRGLVASARKIAVFVSFVMMLVVVLGTIMFIVEGHANGFTSIPTSIYWAITTVTTVGFGDITPKTDLGRAIASLIMLLGWGILAVPTGIVTTELAVQRITAARLLNICDDCGEGEHIDRANHCHKCGSGLRTPNPAFRKDTETS